MINKLVTKGFFYTAVLTISLFLIGCPATTTENTDSGNGASVPNGNASNMNEANMDSNMNATENSEASMVDTKEPETYSAKVDLKAEGIGKDNKAALPGIQATVARDGANKRMEVNLPGGQKVVYLETDGKNYVILPGKKQYAELNDESVGMEVRSLMTPEQIVERAKTIKGLEKVGDEKYEGRDAVKYKYNATTATNTKAGEVDTESYLYVDKETGLPLRTEFASASKDKEVQGMNGIKVVTTMSDIKTEVSADMFKLPEGYEKIDEKQIKDQLNLIFKVVGQFLSQLMQNAS